MTTAFITTYHTHTSCNGHFLGKLGLVLVFILGYLLVSISVILILNILAGQAEILCTHTPAWYFWDISHPLALTAT